MDFWLLNNPHRPLYTDTIWYRSVTIPKQNWIDQLTLPHESCVMDYHSMKLWKSFLIKFCKDIIIFHVYEQMRIIMKRYSNAYSLKEYVSICIRYIWWGYHIVWNHLQICVLICLVTQAWTVWTRAWWADPLLTNLIGWTLWSREQTACFASRFVPSCAGLVTLIFGETRYANFKEAS